MTSITVRNRSINQRGTHEIVVISSCGLAARTGEVVCSSLACESPSEVRIRGLGNPGLADESQHPITHATWGGGAPRSSDPSRRAREGKGREPPGPGARSSATSSP